MGSIGTPSKVKLIVGMLSLEARLFEQAEEALNRLYGPVDLRSDVWPFDFTDYYAKEMGAPLLRGFVSFERLIDPGEIADVKAATNDLESRFASGDDAPSTDGAPSVDGVQVQRPINLDPGYITTGKLVLATTKDYAHRVYVGRGIYAEVTLRFTQGRFRPFDWTYPDYRTPEYLDFFTQVRDRYRRQLAESETANGRHTDHS